ncbi:hypothetical protein ABZ208_14010 [Streptomyces sp. NPDC006208]|uniref:hypothetical protein n=1 Tax=Streptomyces sp. NPDC006208 TaxID=3156734 RepID=UPI0033A69F7C
MSRRLVSVHSELLTTLPVVPAPVARQLLAGLDLAPRRRVPAWVTDPGLRESILAGFIDIPDELAGGAA